MEAAIATGNSTKQSQEYVRFTKTFGTHFVRRTDMGASLTFQKVFKVS